MSKRDKICSARNCFNSKLSAKNTSFFSYPRDETRCKEWLRRAGCENQLHKPATYVSRCGILLCGEHFEDHQFLNQEKKNRLVWNAMPTLFPIGPAGSCLAPYTKSFPIEVFVTYEQQSDEEVEKPEKDTEVLPDNHQHDTGVAVSRTSSVDSEPVVVNDFPIELFVTYEEGSVEEVKKSGKETEGPADKYNDDTGATALCTSSTDSEPVIVRVSGASTLLLEPYFGGSHKQLVDLLCGEFVGSLDVFTLPAKKWHWRARVSALYFAQKVPRDHTYRTLFASSVLNLCELCALRPDLASLDKALYFHENQLEYPVVNPKERDFQYGYNQILSCLVANRIYFNSRYNMESFLGSIHKFFNQMPDHRPSDLVPEIRAKSQVLHFPVELPPAPSLSDHLYWRTKGQPKPLHIVWPHRWEHDKNPDLFFSTLFALQEAGQDFRVSVLGEEYSQVPAIFSEARERLSKEILSWGFQKTRTDYLKVLWNADVVVSTSKHEFFGVAMIEAVACRCYPLCPSRLVYPEIFPSQYLYRTGNQLVKILKGFCRNPHLVRQHDLKIDLSKFSWQNLASDYKEALRL